MSKKRFTSKTYLKWLILAGVIAVIGGGAGTFATFNAEVTNSGNTFANGTLFLHTLSNGVTTCTSESDTINNSGACTFLFNTTLTGGTATATLKLTNAGTINASDIKFKVGNCTVGTNVSATGTTQVFGTAPTCSDLQLAIQETQSDYSTNVFCAYGTQSGNACTIDAGHNLGTATSLTTLLTTGPVNADLAAAASRYYVVQINPNVASDNSLQNRKVTFDLTWHLDQ